MDLDAYKTAQKMNRARAAMREVVADLDRPCAMQLLLEVYDELEAAPAARRGAVAEVSTDAIGRAPSTPSGAAPGEGTLRADVLRVLRESTAPMRTGEITEAVRRVRPDVKMPSVASAIWQFVRDGRVHKKMLRGRDYYATDATSLGRLAHAEATDGDIPAVARLRPTPPLVPPVGRQRVAAPAGGGLQPGEPPIPGVTTPSSRGGGTV